MSKQKNTAYMTTGEQIGGVIFFLIYLLVLPFATDPLFRLAERALGVTFSAHLKNSIYYYLLFAITILIFHNFLGRTTRQMVDRFSLTCKMVGLGLIFLYGLNELVYRLTNLVIINRTNLNNSAISAQINDAPHVTVFIVILLAPVVEEVLFRGLVFGGIRQKNQILAYLVSCLLFALMHVWQFAVVQQDVTYFLLMVQYLVPGWVLAWVYDRSGTLWAPMALHAVANALSVWAIA